jgi:hypothetical protein
MRELRTLEQALAWGDEWEARARQLLKDLERAQTDRDFYLQQSNFWHAELRAIVDLWVKSAPKKRRSPFDEPIAA